MVQKKSFRLAILVSKRFSIQTKFRDWMTKESLYYVILGCFIKNKVFQTFSASILNDGCMYYVQGYQKHILFYFSTFFRGPPRGVNSLKRGFSSCSDYPDDGTLNLCHETLSTHEKESVWSDRSVRRNRPKRAKISVFLFDLTNVGNCRYFGTFWTLFGTERLD